MVKALKLPKRIKGVKLPKAARKTANQLLKRVSREELEDLAGVVIAAVIAHLADREGKARLSQRVSKAVGNHLTR